jgi:hypothetical protein
MSTLPSPSAPSTTPTTINAPQRLVLVAVLALVAVLVLSTIRVDTASTPLARIHLRAITKALTVATAADTKGHGTATEYNVSLTANRASYVGVVENLGQVSGNPRVVEYNIYSSGAWVPVCVLLPVGGYPVYPVICPGA